MKATVLDCSTAPAALLTPESPLSLALSIHSYHLKPQLPFLPGLWTFAGSIAHSGGFQTLVCKSCLGGKVDSTDRKWVSRRPGLGRTGVIADESERSGVVETVLQLDDGAGCTTGNWLQMG